MRIVVTDSPPTVTLDEADDFTSFAVSAPVAAADDLGERLGPVGEYDGVHAWVDREALADLADSRASDAGWQAGLTAMIDYARSHDFLSEDGAAIRAHVDWSEE